eukprot:4983968-Amphidinium_carterae.1
MRHAAELELALKRGVRADPQVALDLYTVKKWQRAFRGTINWHPTEEEWVKAAVGRRGRGPSNFWRSA